MMLALTGCTQFHDGFFHSQKGFTDGLGITPGGRGAKTFFGGDVAHQAIVVDDARNALCCCVKHFHGEGTLENVASQRTIHGVHHVDGADEFREFRLCERPGDFGLKRSPFHLLHQHRPNTTGGCSVSCESDFGPLSRGYGFHRFNQQFKRFEVPDSADVANSPPLHRFVLALFERRKGTIFDRMAFEAVVSKPFDEASATIRSNLLTGRDDHASLGGSLKHALLQAATGKCSQVGLRGSIPHPGVLQIVHIKHEGNAVRLLQGRAYTEGVGVVAVHEGWWVVGQRALNHTEKAPNPSVG